MLGKLTHGVDLLLKLSHAVFGDAVSQELNVGDAEDAFVFSGDEAVFAEWLEDDSEVLEVLLFVLREEQGVVHIAHSEG